MTKYIASFFIVIVLIFLFGLTSGNVSLAQPEYVLLVDLIVTKEHVVEVETIKIIEGEPTLQMLEGDYSLALTTSDNQLLHQELLPISFEFHYDPSPEIISLDKVNIIKRLPLFLEAEHLLVYYQDEIIAKINLAQEVCQQRDKDEVCYEFCSDKGLDPDCFGCGNTVCDPSEDETSCPQDCARDIAASQEKPASSNLGLWLMAALAAIAVIVILILVFLRSKQKKRVPDL